MNKLVTSGSYEQVDKVDSKPCIAGEKSWKRRLLDCWNKLLHAMTS